jgi:hypothetical protein
LYLHGKLARAGTGSRESAMLAAQGMEVSVEMSYRSPKTVVKESAIEGRGLFAVAPIAAGEIVVVKGGRVFDRSTLERVRPKLETAEIQISENLFIGPLDLSEREGAMIFSNHSCEPNLGLRGQIVFVALREIAVGEELTHDWAMTDDDGETMECRCGTASCRKIVTGQDWRRRDLQGKYRGFFSSYLTDKIRTLEKNAD